jgi:hypothetical protein
MLEPEADEYNDNSNIVAGLLLCFQLVGSRYETFLCAWLGVSSSSPSGGLNQTLNFSSSTDILLSKHQ